MFSFGSLAKSLQPLDLNSDILDVAFELYLNAPQESSPTISLQELAARTGASYLECRNTIVNANRVGRFPNCSLSW